MTKKGKKIQLNSCMGKQVTNLTKNEPSMEDWIGQLPRDVLGVIFSHLTLIEAGRTSIISHRWKDLWTLTPHFNFDFSKRFWRILRDVKSIEKDMVIEDERKKYLKWVNQLVENYQGTDDLSEFVIFFPLDVRDSCHLDKWIEFALRKRVKELKIDLVPWFSRKGAEAYSFPKAAPVISGIECLTSLCLQGVNITGEMMEQFLSICPLLERLSLIRSEQISNLRIVGSSLKLKYLNIEFCSSLESIHIFAPNLESFHFLRPNGRNTKWQVEGLYCLVDLHIGSGDIIYELTQFSSYFPQLEKFSMDFDYGEMYLQQLRLSRFTKLKHLKFMFTNDSSLYMSGLYKFINLSCPYLHKFTVEMSVEFFHGEMDVPIPWGKRSHQCLKVVEMIMFVGARHEVKLAKQLLKSAINLEKLIIDTRDKFALEMYPDDMHLEEYEPGSRQRAEQLREIVRPGVELIII